MKARSLLVSLVVALTVVACAHAPASVVTPQGKAAFAADQVLVRLQEAQNAVIVAATPDAAGHVSLPKPTADIIVSFTVEAAKAIKQTPNGWLAVVSSAWTSAKAKIPANVAAQAQGYILAIDTLLAGAGASPIPMPESNAALQQVIDDGERFLTGA